MIIKNLKLNSKEKEIAENAFEYLYDAIDWITEANSLEADINTLKSIINLSEKFNSINIKAKKKYESYTKYQTGLQYDALEYFELGHSLLFDLYKKHIDKSQLKEKYLVDSAYYHFNVASHIRENVYKNIDYELGIYHLYKATYYEYQALKEVEYAICLQNNIKLDYNYFNTDFIAEYKTISNNLYGKNLVADITPLDNKENYIKQSDNLQVYSNSNSISSEKVFDNNLPANNYTKENINDVNNDKENYEILALNYSGNNESKELNEKINTNEPLYYNVVFKIQIGAFKNNVDESIFHGLKPLSKDYSDKNFACKYLVGNYYSYKVAKDVKDIIINTTPYKDAFIVAYVNGERTDINYALKQIESDIEYKYVYNMNSNY
ncbi:MAG: hypothetical protein Kow0068_06780 [Marinilabiliales bacterium]